VQHQFAALAELAMPHHQQPVLDVEIVSV